jgi:uncharacterized protein (TIGR03435 family)
VDATGLTGTFDIDLVWALESTADSGVGQLSPVETSASIFTAVQEQLGLKLEPARGPVDVLVVESIRRPTPD